MQGAVTSFFVKIVQKVKYEQFPVLTSPFFGLLKERYMDTDFQDMKDVVFTVFRIN
jgi:hypothetical protein